jgi:nickel/cobalt exporter
VHSHVAVTPDQIKGSWRESLGVVLSIGLRPCSGALVVLVFALSQGVLWAGIASVFLMGLGTAITVAALATLAMTAKGLARRLAGGKASIATRLVWWGELFGAFLVFAFGILLVVANLWG